jgi:hypothetical protein
MSPDLHPGDTNAAFSGGPPPFPCIDAGLVEGHTTFTCIPTPNGGLALASAASPGTSGADVRLPPGIRSICAVWKPDDLPPPYSEVVAADEAQAQIGGVVVDGDGASDDHDDRDAAGSSQVWKMYP